MAHGGRRPHARLGKSQHQMGGAVKGRRGAAPQRRSRFETSRVQDVEGSPDVKEDLQDDIASESESDIEEAESASEDETPVTRQSYTALLQTLKAGTREKEPPRKRRKLDATPSNVQPNGETADLEEDVFVDAVANQTDAADTPLVEDSEGGPEDGDESASLDDSENEDLKLRDPFEQHYVSIQEEALKHAISDLNKKRIDSTLLGDQVRKQTITRDSLISSTRKIRSSRDLNLKRRLQNTGSEVIQSLNDEERDVAAEIAGHRDIQYGNRTIENASRVRDVVSLHALNHVFKTRDRVLKNNAKLSQQANDEELDLRDQGFTRPKVLFIVPTKQACARFVASMVKVSEPEQQENKSRFLDTFTQEDDNSWENKPEDFRELFGGNHEEDFRVGLKFTRKTIKYFSGFYNSDIIFGSALGLMRTITTGGGGKDKKKGHDADFLSSIEVVVVDHAAAIQMQNFQHLEYVFSQLNQLPKDSHGCDFARVRHWYLDGNAKHLRQTILLASHHTPELNSLMSNHAHNISGLAKYTPTYTGAMLALPPTLSHTTIPQTFLRFDSPTPQTDPDSRFTFFTTAILPSLLRAAKGGGGTLIFVPAYHDFVRLRNHFATAREAASLSFGSVSEYTSARDTARARSHFASGRHGALVYSERAHHHFRYRVRGVRRVVFYGVPENPVFWGEIVGLLGLGSGPEGQEVDTKGGRKGVVRAMFSRWDVLKLERVVGTERVGRLVNDRGGDTFEFV